MTIREEELFLRTSTIVEALQEGNFDQPQTWNGFLFFEDWINNNLINNPNLIGG